MAYIMRFMREIKRGGIAALLAGIALMSLGFTPRALPPSPFDLQASTMRLVVMNGKYAEALRIAYGDWQAHNWKARVQDQTIQIAQRPGSRYLYVLFLPRQGPKPTLGCATYYGVELHYTIDVENKRIVQKAMPC
jgi:hypothetical protein